MEYKQMLFRKIFAWAVIIVLNFSATMFFILNEIPYRWVFFFVYAWAFLYSFMQFERTLKIFKESE